MLFSPRVKICCISSVQEAGMAIKAGASAIGLVSAMPSGPGVIEDELIREIANWCPPGIASFLLSSRTDAEAIIEQVQYCATSTIQLVDAVAPAEHRKIKKALPNLKLVQVIHIRGDLVAEELTEYEETVDAILLDSGDPSLPVKELGGTGKRHNWEISRDITVITRKPVYLAGGLHANNVAAAIRQVRPFAVDVCSGVRTAGKLDEYKLVNFMRARKTLVT